MRIDAPLRDDVAEVARNLRPLDVKEFIASGNHASPEEMVDSLIREYGGRDDTFCAYVGETPVLIGAVTPVDADKLVLGMFATERFPEIAGPFAKFVRRRLLPQYWSVGFRAVETYSLESYVSAHRWMRTLGLQRAGEIQGPRGDVFFTFRLERPDALDG